jgi:O-antigen ligase
MDTSSFTVRIKLAESALEIIKENPLLGVGAGNFVIGLSQREQIWQWLYWLQPVHNIFLLLSSELGLLLAGFFIFTYLKLFFNSSKNWMLLACLFSITLTGLFDHYWLTLIQNQILLAIILSFSYCPKSPSLNA